MTTALPEPGTERPHAESVPPGAVRLDALHNIGTAEGIRVWRYEPGHPMSVAFTTTVDAGDLDDEAWCEEVFVLLNIGHDPAEVGTPGEPDPRALDYRARGNRSLMMGDVVGVTRAGTHTAHYAVAAVGFARIDPPSVVDRPGHGTVPLT